MYDRNFLIPRPGHHHASLTLASLTTDNGGVRDPTRTCIANDERRLILADISGVAVAAIVPINKASRLNLAPGVTVRRLTV